MSLHYVCTCTFVLFDNWDLLTFCVCMYVHMYLCIYNYIYVWKHISRLVHFVRPCHLIKSEILHLNAIKTIVSYGTVQLQPHFYTRVHAWRHAVFRVCIT